MFRMRRNTFDETCRGRQQLYPFRRVACQQKRGAVRSSERQRRAFS